jgi:hypothetical protein
MIIPHLEDQVPVFISLSNTVAQLYPRALSSRFVASHNSQGCGGGILSLLREVTTQPKSKLRHN